MWERNIDQLPLTCAPTRPATQSCALTRSRNFCFVGWHSTKWAMLVRALIESWGFFVYAGWKSFIRYMIHKIFSLSMYGLSFIILTLFQKLSFYIEWNPIYQFVLWWIILSVVAKETLPSQGFIFFILLKVS